MTSSAWTLHKLGDVATFRGGFSYKSADWKPSGFPVIKISNVRDGRVSLEDCSYIDAATAEATEEYKVANGDLLMTLTGEIGAVGIHRGPVEARLNQRLCKVTEKDPMVLSRDYLHYFLTSPEIRQEMWARSKGAAQANISISDIVTLEIPLPPLDEQRRIVATLEDHLSRLDKVLAEVSEAGEKALAFKKSYLLSVTEGSAAELKPSLQDWKSTPISGLGTWRGGGTPSKRESSFWLDGDVPWLTAKDMKRFSIEATEDYITMAGVQGSSATLLPARSVVVVARSGILEHTLPVAVSEMPLTINQDLKALVCNPGIDPKWVGYSLMAQGQRILNRCRKAGTTVANINFQEFLKFELKVPPLEQQSLLVRQIENALGSLDSILFAKRHLEFQLSEMRRALLKHAFEGKLSGDTINA